MDERMTLCNMSIEGGARVGYVNPDETTFAYLKGRPFAPKAQDWERAVTYWKAIASDADAQYDDVVKLRAEDIAPCLTWGVNPGHVIAIDEDVPTPEAFSENERPNIVDALKYMQLAPGKPIKGEKVAVTFIGSCTNSRISDLREVAKHVQGHHVAAGVKALVVPGSQEVKKAAEAEGLDAVFRAAGFEWREPGCSMCLGMNPDKLVGDQLCASSSNRNFKGRMGSPTGRTLLMSPVMVAAAAIRGSVSDAREVFGMKGN
jgi:3-isopropylmalate/(R)-2-methylmalate dehydratase large subunit